MYHCETDTNCKRRLAEGVGFEPTRVARTPLVFETSALSRSAIPPKHEKQATEACGARQHLPESFVINSSV